MAIKRAKRQSVPLKIGLSGVSGSGKTYSALRLARGLVGSWQDIAVLDTENESSNLYSDLGDYGVFEMKPPFHPDRFIKAIDYFVSEGVKCMIIDSATHEWDGEGGCLDIYNKLGGQFHHWSKVTPMHDKFLRAILHAPIHVICTTRKKQDHAMSVDGGKTKVSKLGLKDIQREGFEYELTSMLTIDENHYALKSKDRTGLFDTEAPFIITETIGEWLRDWSNGKSAKEILGNV